MEFGEFGVGGGRCLVGGELFVFVKFFYFLDV